MSDFYISDKMHACCSCCLNTETGSAEKHFPCPFFFIGASHSKNMERDSN